MRDFSSPLTLSMANLYLHQGERLLLKNLSLHVQNGDAIMLKGPNGSGKTTLLRAIANLHLPTKGHIHLNRREERAVFMHYVGHKDGLHPALTPLENVQFWYDVAAHPALSPQEALEYFHLSALRHVPFLCLSKGQKRRVALARLLVDAKPIWLLDEPTTGLDTSAITHIEDKMAEHRAHGGVIITATHLPLHLPKAGVISLPLGNS